MSFALRHPTRVVNFARLRSQWSETANLKGLLARHMGVDPGKLRFREHHVEHHIAHAASAFYPSDFDEAAVFSFDGSRDFVSVMYARGRGSRLEPFSRVLLPNSLGNFYSAVCQLIGYLKYGNEGKVMGLAP